MGGSYRSLFLLSTWSLNVKCRCSKNNSFGDKVKLHEKYPALAEEFLGLEQPQHHDKQAEDLDSIMAAYSFEDELQQV